MKISPISSIATPPAGLPKVPAALPMDVRQQLADLAHVPAQNREDFYNVIQMPVRLVWELDRRALGIRAGDALERAAEAARALHEAFEQMNSDDREWVEKLWTKVPYKHLVSELPRTVQGLSDLFSIAVGKAPLQNSRDPSSRGPKKGTVKNLAFLEFVHYLLVVTEQWCGGKLTSHKHYKNGTLIDAIDILRPHLPSGLVPDHLPFGTIQKVKSNPGLYNGFPPIDFWG